MLQNNRTSYADKEHEIGDLQRGEVMAKRQERQLVASHKPVHKNDASTIHMRD